MKAATKAPRPILIVENSPEVRRALAHWLRLVGYNVLTAVDGSDALAKLRAQSKPCLILLDLHLPHSLEFRRMQLQNLRASKIPLVVYSGLYDPRAGAKQLQAAAYFATPFDLDALQRVIEAHCKKYQRPPRRRAHNGNHSRQ